MSEDLLADLNDEQRAAVTYGEGPLLIIAGVGTGKTTVITRRIAWLIAQKMAKPAEILALTFTEHWKRLQKELTKLEKQQVELLAFDEKLRHYADMRITLDLDDGVKVNYVRFGDLLAEAKAVHGKRPEVA